MKTSELTGAHLDFWVAKAECLLGPTQKHFFKTYAIHSGACRAHSEAAAWQPSGNWAVGGPIIERERIAIMGDDAIDWVAAWQTSSDQPEGRGFRRVGGECWQYGPTPLVAAMRAYVASKFGEEVVDKP